MTDEGSVWSFGYGSNMDMDMLERSKGIKVLDHTPAVLEGYRLAFNMPGIPLVEPGFAGLEEEEGEDVHGIAFRLGGEAADMLDRREGVGFHYRKSSVNLKAYDGRLLTGRVSSRCR